MHEGVVEAYWEDAAGSREFLHAVRNQLQFSFAEVLCRVLGQRDTAYLLNAAYIEFANVAAPEDAVAVPSYTGNDGLDYYLGLSSSPDRDYLRVSLDQPAALALAPGYEDRGAVYNRMTFDFRTSGSIGVHGKTFSDLVNSKVYGIAMASAPVWGDKTQDVLFSRLYYDASQQALKAAGKQLALRYRHDWKLPG